jgi:hypothetical protein
MRYFLLFMVYWMPSVILAQSNTPSTDIFDKFKIFYGDEAFQNYQANFIYTINDSLI